jgi:hypothetical protein
MSAHTVTVDGFVRFDPDLVKAGVEKPFRWIRGNPVDYGKEYVDTCMAQVPITFELPDGFHPTAAMVKALEAERAKLQAEFTRSVAEINDQIAKLLAISFDGSAS